MSRQLRIVIPGMAYHVMARGTIYFPVTGGLKNTQIAELFGNIHSSMVGRKIKEIATKTDQDKTMKKDIWEIIEKYVGKV
jgi:hypothetical protein